MKELVIVANWKENKTVDEAVVFMEEFKASFSPREGTKVIICPPFTSLSALFQFELENSLGIFLGVQDVSQFEKGAHTGEVSAEQVKGLAKYSIIGHSERRAMGESDEVIKKKVLNAQAQEIIPIFCVQNEDTSVAAGVEVVAYEPPTAIGTGNPDTPENAQRVAIAIKEKNPSVKKVLYGGSVTADNVGGFCLMSDIDGVLVGGASLDAQNFSQIIKNA